MTEHVGLYAKMVKVMEQMERVPKRGYNDHFKYQFVTDADVLDAVRAALVKQQIALFVSFDGAERQDKGVTVGKFVLTFVDAETGQAHSVNWVGEGQDTQDKGSAKAATSAVKYALLKTFLISTGDDVDDPDADLHANGHAAKSAPVRKAAPVTQAPQSTPDEPPDAWDEEEAAATSAADEQFIDIAEVGVFSSKTGKQHLGLMEAGHKWPDIRWWAGRDKLLQAAPWLAQAATKEQLAVMDARYPFKARVYYEPDGDFKKATRFERVA